MQVKVGVSKEAPREMNGQGLGLELGWDPRSCGELQPGEQPTAFPLCLSQHQLPCKIPPTDTYFLRVQRLECLAQGASMWGPGEDPLPGL